MQVADLPLYTVSDHVPHLHPNPSFALWCTPSFWGQGWLSTEGWPPLCCPPKLSGKTLPASSFTDHPELKNNSVLPPPGAFPDPRASSCAPLWCPFSTFNRLWLLFNSPWLWDPRVSQVWMWLPLHLAYHLEWVERFSPLAQLPLPIALWLYFSLNNALKNH